MSIKLMTAVWDNKTGTLTKDETSYLVKLCDSAAENGTQVWPSRKVLVKKTRISESSQKRLDKSLTEKGYLEVISRERANGSRTSNEYRINANKLLFDAGMELLTEEEMGGISQTPPPVRLTPPPVSVTAPPGQADRPYKHPFKQEVKQKENKEKKNAASLRSKIAVSLIAEIFEYWQRVMNHPGAKLDDSRIRVITKALKMYSTEDVKKAIDGCASSEWHMNSKQDNLGLILRNAEKIEGFIARLDVPAKGNSLADEVKAYVNTAPRMHKTEEESKREIERAMPQAKASPQHVSGLMETIHKSLGKPNMETRNVRNHSRGVIPTVEQRHRDSSEDVISPRSAQA